MTAQIGDTYFYEGNQYSIVAMSKPIEFSPEDYGAVPESRCTACWAGYWCEYEITTSQILLKNLYINTKDNKYPEINGVPVQAQPKKEKLRYQYMGHHLYKNVNLPIRYTGRIIAGDGFLRGYYIHMGYQRAWAYETLKEFVFEDGKLMDMIDHSEMAKLLREEIEESKHHLETPSDTNMSADAISQFVQDSFSLEMKTKCWWLE